MQPSLWPTAQLTEPERMHAEIAAGALFVVNDSGGKDSQAMLIRVAAIVPRRQLLVVHAHLPGVAWPGTLEAARGHAEAAELPFLVAQAGKTFVGMVENRFASRPTVPSFPSATTRQCTSDLKRGPIEREIRHYVKEHGFTRIVNCMGLRAQESKKRAKAQTWQVNKSQSVAGRSWFNWLPVHHLSVDEVFATIKAAGQTPHWAYAAGNERLSCLFCIMGSANDARNAALYMPEAFEQYVTLERTTGYTAHVTQQSVEQLTGLTVAEAYAGRRPLPVLRT